MFESRSVNFLFLPIQKNLPGNFLIRVCYCVHARMLFVSGIFLMIILFSNNKDYTHIHLIPNYHQPLIIKIKLRKTTYKEHVSTEHLNCEKK